MAARTVMGSDPSTINLEHLRAFARAAELGSFTRAADSLGLAQSSISRIIGELEAEWGGALFYRTGRGVELSTLGHEALKKIQTLLSDFDQMSEEMLSRGRLPSGSVAIALPPSLISSFLPTLFDKLRLEKPEIRLRVHEGSSAQIERWLTDGVADVGLHSEYHVEGQFTEPKYPELTGAEGLTMTDAPLMLAGPAGVRDLPHQIDFEHLAEFPLVLPTPNKGLRMVVDAVARRMSVKLKVVAEADSVFAQETLTLECGCYMLRSAMPVEKTEKNFSACTLRNPSIHRRIVLSTASKKSLSRAAREIASLATSILARR